MVVVARLPLLFLIDSILNGALLNFSSHSLKLSLQETATYPLEAASEAFSSSSVSSFFAALFWFGVKSAGKYQFYKQELHSFSILFISS